MFVFILLNWKFTENHLMYMDDIKRFAKNEKRSENLDKNNKNIQPWYRNGIWDWKMFHENNKKWEK